MLFLEKLFVSPRATVRVISLINYYCPLKLFDSTKN